MPIEAKKNSGFHGSETTSAEVAIHTQSGDPVILTTAQERAGRIPVSGTRRTDRLPVLVQVGTKKTLGAPSGSWSLTCKAPYGMRKLFDQILDDDWVDITFKRHGRTWHTMRGLVDDVRRVRTVGGTGATVETWTLTGRDFGKIWEITPLWFNVYTSEKIAGTYINQILLNKVGQLTVDAAVQALMLTALDDLAASANHGVWKPPSSLAGITQERFIKSVNYYTAGFTNTPARTLLTNSTMMDGFLWNLAQEWADPMFTEMFADLAVPVFNNDDREATVDDTEMRLTLRDKPFPTVDGGTSSPYFNLPLTVLPRAIVTHDVGRHGMERYNSFFMITPLAPESRVARDLAEPLWSTADILRHGMRRFDVTSRYVSGTNDVLGLSRALRVIARDWHCMNPYFLNGSLQLAIGMPQIRVGERVRIPGNAPNGAEDETYYVEDVSNDWLFGTGLRTGLGVTHGWIGSDDSYLAALGSVVGEYSSPPPA